MFGISYYLKCFVWMIGIRYVNEHYTRLPPLQSAK